MVRDRPRGDWPERPERSEREDRPARGPAGGPARPTSRGSMWGSAGGGKGRGPRGAIANEAGLDACDTGAIDIADHYSLVESPAEMAEEVIQALRRATQRRKRMVRRRDGDAE